MADVQNKQTHGIRLGLFSRSKAEAADTHSEKSPLLRKLGISAVAAAMAVCLTSGASLATTVATPDTTGQFLNGVAPHIGNQRLDVSTVQVCYQTFCAIASTDTKGAIATAERLTKAQVEAAMGKDRSSMAFFPDPHIPASGSAQSSDYTRSGYDRGHMAPWADSADPDCFTLANIVPQNPDNNRHLWEHIEVTVRRMAQRYGEVFIVSGPIFYGHQPVRMKNTEILVPTSFFKAIYIPSLNVASAYIVRNTAGDWWKPATISDVEKLTGTDVFPALSSDIKSRLVSLPYPGSRRDKTPPAPGNLAASDFSFSSVPDETASVSEEHGYGREEALRHLTQTGMQMYRRLMH